MLINAATNKNERLQKKCRGKKKDTNKPENPSTNVTPSEITPISEEIGNEN